MWSHTHTHTQSHKLELYKLMLAIITVIYFALLSPSHTLHTPVYSPTHMKLCLQAQTHTLTYAHSCFHMQGEQTLTHTLKHRCFRVSCSQFHAPHTCSYILHAALMLLCYWPRIYTPVMAVHTFLTDFCNCIAKNPTCRIQQDWVPR